MLASKPDWKAAAVRLSLFLGIALLIMLPELLIGPSYSHSRLYNIVWSEQVNTLVAQGQLYPRWLPQAWDGLGSPTFYFYAPLFFLTSAWIGVAANGALSAATTASLASALFLGLSGGAMYRWLSIQTSSRVALVASIAYMLAPYHLHDIYNRGALAEATTYVSLPLVLDALSRLKTGGARAMAQLALAYALLIFGHLPVALLASTTIIPAFVLWRARQGGAQSHVYLARALAGGLLGLGLSSLFFLPALGLMPHIAADQLATAFYQPDQWFFFWGPNSIIAPSRPDYVEFNIMVAFGALALAFALWPARRGVADAGFYAVLGGVLFLLVSGLFPFYWDLPGVRQVQFPARLFVVIECVAISGIAIGWGAVRKPIVAAAALLFAVASWQSFGMAQHRMAVTAEQGDALRADLVREFRDAPEYVPNGFPVRKDAMGQAEPTEMVLPEGPVVQLSGSAILVGSVQTRADGGLRVVTEGKDPTTVTVRRFAYPFWQIRDDTGQVMPLEPTEYRLVRFTAPPGRHHYTLSRLPARFERLAQGIATLSLALILVLLLADRMRRRA